MMTRHRLVGDDRDLASRPKLAIRSPSVAAGRADRDVIGAGAERDIDGDRIAGAERRGHGARLPARAFRRDSGRASPPDFIDDGFVRHVARFHREVGLGIDRIALLDQPPQRLLWIGRRL
jgi:hypothetical protein